MQKETLTSQEVIEMLGADVDLNYLYYLRRSRQLMPIDQKESIRIKPRLLYRRSDVEAFKTKREAEKESHARRIVA